MKSSDTLNQIKSPCKHLRNKEMYYQTATPEEECHSGAHWCAKTQEPFGPDGESAGATHCCAERGCYVD